MRGSSFVRNRIGTTKSFDSATANPAAPDRKKSLSAIMARQAANKGGFKEEVMTTEDSNGHIDKEVSEKEEDK